MDKLFLTILNMSLTGAFVIAAICLARLPLKKVPKIISYCLWAVAGFRLVFPFSIESVFSLIPFRAQTIPPDIAMQPIPRIDSGISFVNNAVSSILPAATPDASVNPLQIWTTIGAWVWLVGVAILFIYGVLSFFILKRKMSGSAHIEANIYEAENIKSPFVLGVFNPRIYLPIGLSEQEKSYIILHEQTHIRRNDHIVKFAAYFVLCLHWFNPFAWVAFLLMGADMEMSCDERVLKEMGGETKKDYSLSLLSLATEGRIIGGSPLAFGEGGIKERVKNVLNFKKPPRVIIVAAIALVAVLSVGFAVNRASAALNTTNRELKYIGINGFALGSPVNDVMLASLTPTDRYTNDDYDHNYEEVRFSLDAETGVIRKLWVNVSESGIVCSLDDTTSRGAWTSISQIRGYFGEGKQGWQDRQQNLRYIEHTQTEGSLSAKIRFVYTDDEYDRLIWVIAESSLPYPLSTDNALRELTLDELRSLAAKGDALQYPDFPSRGLVGLSSTLGGYNPVLYGVEGGYRLIVNFNDTMKPENGIMSTVLESIWESGGSGIDIRYEDVDEFIRTHPSHSAIIGEEALAIAESYANKIWTLIDVDWWEREDEFPHNSRDPFKQTLSESMNSIEPCELFTDGEGRFIAVGREHGTVYVYSDGVWVVATDNAEPKGTTPSETLNKIYLGMTSAEVYELFGEPDYQASGLMWFGYNEIGTFDPGFGFNGAISRIDAGGKHWDVDELIRAAVKQRTPVDTVGASFESHIVMSLDADKNGFTVWVASLYQTFIPNGEYDVSLVDSTYNSFEMHFTKNENYDYILSECNEREVDWEVNLKSLEQSCYTDAMYHFVGAIPSDGRYGIGAGTAILTSVAESTTENGYFTIKYFPGATLQIEEYDGEHAPGKPESWIIEYADSSKNKTVGKDGMGEIPITDDLIGIFHVGQNQYAMKFEKYVVSTE